jgi:chromosome segregation ATPase
LQSIDDLAAFVQACKELQNGNTNLRKEATERIHAHEQTSTRLHEAAKHQRADQTDMLKAVGGEINLLRQDKEALKESIENLQSENVTFRDEVGMLETSNAKLQHEVDGLNRSAEGLHQTIIEGSKSYDDYRKRVKALLSEL